MLAVDEVYDAEKTFGKVLKRKGVFAA